MPIKLRNKGRAPVTVELALLGEQTQVDVRIGRDPKTGAFGPMELQRSYPNSVFIPGRGSSEELPDAVKNDPALRGRIDLAVESTSPSNRPPRPPPALPGSRRPARRRSDLAVESTTETTSGAAGKQAPSAPKEL